MCGFVGFTNKINDASIVLGKMMDRIKHRGPDSDGKYVDEQIAMGFRRYTTTRISVRSLSLLVTSSIHRPTQRCLSTAMSSGARICSTS